MRWMRLTVLALALFNVACTVQQTGTPPLTGPSEASGPLLPLVQTPTARFSVAPETPLANSPVAFDGRLSCTGLADPTKLSEPCAPTGGAITAYSWSFGGFGTASGPTATFTFDTQRTYNVTLTVTNDGGRSSSTTRAVTVGAGLLPTPDFVISPTNPAVGQTIFVNGSISTPGGGHFITGYSWNWGDGATTTGVTSSHVYSVAGTYVIVLTVSDEEGQTKSKNTSVSVGTGQPTASFSFSISGTAVTLDGSASTAVGGATISNYAWSFGDGSSATGPAAVASRNYGSSGSRTVTLTVTDSLGRSGATSQVIAIP